MKRRSLLQSLLALPALLVSSCYLPTFKKKLVPPKESVRYEMEERHPAGWNETHRTVYQITTNAQGTVTSYRTVCLVGEPLGNVAKVQLFDQKKKRIITEVVRFEPAASYTRGMNLYRSVQC